MSKNWRKFIPCPSDRDCGNQIRYKGPSSTPSMCRECYQEEIKVGGRLRQQAIGYARRARQVRSEKPKPKAPGRVAPANLLDAPMEHLWFESNKVFEFVKSEVGDSARMELSKDSRLAARWDTWRGRPWVRYDQVDELLCVLGLWIGDLGDPVWSGNEKRYPVLEAA